MNLSWTDFLDANPTGQGAKPQCQSADFLRGFLRLHGVTYASHRLLEYYAPAQLVTLDTPGSMCSVASTAEYGSEASSQGDRSVAGPDAAAETSET